MDKHLPTIAIIASISFFVGMAVGICSERSNAEAASKYRLTYYDESFTGNPMFCTEEPYDPNDPTVAASGSEGFSCATTLRVCTRTCLILTVQDRCGGCSGQHIDVSESAWHLLGGMDYGTVEPLTTTPLQLPATGLGAENERPPVSTEYTTSCQS